MTISVRLLALLTIGLSGCSDRAIFVTSTDLGISANSSTQQLNIGFTRAELFQGPNYPDVGEAPQVVGFIGSDQTPFAPHVRQLYATGVAANLVTIPDLPPCLANSQPGAINACPEISANLTGDRRPMVFATGTNVGLNVGFNASTPPSVKLGYDREEISIIPLRADDKRSQGSDQYSSVLASIDLNGSVSAYQSTDLKNTQFFATGAAARNLAKNKQIRDLFEQVATNSVNASLVQASQLAITQDNKDIDAYFAANSGQSFGTVRDTLLQNTQLRPIAAGFSADLKSATSAVDFDKALNTQANATFIDPIAKAAKDLTPKKSS